MKRKILFIVSLLFGLLFINAGLNKFFNYMPMPEDMPESMVKLMTAFQDIGWLMPLIAIVEILGGILFITNRYRALAAIILFPIVVGIVLTHVVNEPSGLPVALVIAAVEIWVILENKEKYMPMIR